MPREDAHPAFAPFARWHARCPMLAVAHADAPAPCASS